jgi:Uma2 family endonuclease
MTIKVKRNRIVGAPDLIVEILSPSTVKIEGKN